MLWPLCDHLVFFLIIHLIHSLYFYKEIYFLPKSCRFRRLMIPSPKAHLFFFYQTQQPCPFYTQKHFFRGRAQILIFFSWVTAISWCIPLFYNRTRLLVLYAIQVPFLTFEDYY